MGNKKIILIIFTIALIFIAGCGKQVNDPAIDALANCLVEKGVKEYGAFWCPNCAKQEKMFGASMQILKSKSVYIECDPRCDTTLEDLPIACRGIIGQPNLCLEKDVNKYPDWEFTDGLRLVGVQELNILAEKAGCDYK